MRLYLIAAADTRFGRERPVVLGELLSGFCAGEAASWTGKVYTESDVQEDSELREAVERWKARADDLAHLRYRALDTLGGFVEDLPNLERAYSNEYDVAQWRAYADDSICAAALRIQDRIDELEEGQETLADEAKTLYEPLIPRGEARRRVHAQGFIGPQ
jgi:hypothetical protein